MGLRPGGEQADFIITVINNNNNIEETRCLSAASVLPRPVHGTPSHRCPLVRRICADKPRRIVCPLLLESALGTPKNLAVSSVTLSGAGPTDRSPFLGPLVYPQWFKCGDHRSKVALHMRAEHTSRAILQYTLTAPARQGAPPATGARPPWRACRGRRASAGRTCA
jgi:hypothetical protein